jgi:predicted ATP-dependent endonuclease of OLD family
LSEKLIIRNFGPITNVDLDLRKVNVLIGDQGTGKSTVAKVLMAVKNSIFREIFDLPKDNEIDEETNKFLAHLDLVGVRSFIKSDTEIIYIYKDYSLNFIENKVTIKLNVEISVSESIFFNVNYIPAERNMLTILADSLYALIELKTDLTRLFLRFGTKFLTARKKKEIFDYKNILGVSYLYKNGKDKILLSDGNEINLSDASSGIQGSIVWLVVFDDIVSEEYQTGRLRYSFLEKNLKLLVIEEPELNCYPETQNKLLKYIITNNILPSSYTSFEADPNDEDNPNVFEVEDYQHGYFKNQLVLTTHSPYILTSLNNLMYANEVGKIYPDESEKVIDTKYWLNPNVVSAYELKKDGTCEDIFNRVENLIGAEKIDEISNTLNEQFDALLNIELVPR